MLGLEIVEGSGLIRDYEIDSGNTWVVNEATKKLIGWDEMAGRQITIGDKTRDVAGVVQDYHIASLRRNIKQTAYFISPSGFRVSPDNILARVTSEDYFALVGNLERIWKKYSSDPFEMTFVDDEINELYVSERRFLLIVNFFTVIAVLVALIGLFGLVNFQARQRLGEICVRKVLGAGELSLVRIMSSDFIGLYFIALLIGIPTAYWVGNQWLSSYVIKTNYGVDTFALSVILGLFISMVVLLSQVLRVTRVNPVTILNKE